MAYPPDKWTDDALNDLENRIAEVYRDAAKDLDKEVKAYFAKFDLRDKEMQKKVAAGAMTQAEYQQWRMTQIGRGKRFEAMRDKMAERFTQANEVTNAYVNDATPNLYSLNRNYEAYTIEKTVGACDFNLMDESTVRRLLVEQPDLMPYYPPSRALDRGIDLEYGKSQITKHVTSGIIRGIPPSKIANELMANVEGMNRTSAVRAARTAVTAAQNAGRMDSYIAAEKQGIKIRRKWICTKDSKTRHTHGKADGQIVNKTTEPFKVGGYKMMFPGDKSMGAPGHEIYNCRCTARTVEKDGIEAEPRQTRVRNPEWEEAKAQEDELTNRIEKLKEREQKETDPEKKKQIRKERLATQKELSEATKKRQSVDKNVLVNDMNYSEWQKWKQTGVKPEPPKPTKPKKVEISTPTQARKAIGETFNIVGNGVSGFADDQIVIAAQRLQELENRFGCAKKGKYTIEVAKVKDAMAYVRSTKTTGNNLVLNSEYYGSPSKALCEKERKNITSGFSMPCADEQLKHYTITHEYGHILENTVLEARLGDAYYTKSKRDSGAKAIWAEIVGIAKENNPDFKVSKNISRYGKTDYWEAFAETFANGMCGEPNELGNALNVWLERMGY